MNYKTQHLIANYPSMLKQLVMLLLLCYLILITTGCQLPNKNQLELPGNFHKISDDVYRAEQPTTKQLQNLNELGFKTIINLRLMHSDRGRLTDTNLSEVWVRMRAGDINDENMIEVLTAIAKSPKPILIHCWHGSDRTGVVSAMYRLVFQNWTKEQAINELMQPELGYHKKAYPNIIQYLKQVDVEKIRAVVFQ